MVVPPIERHPDDLPPSGLRPPGLTHRLPRGIGWAVALAAVTLVIATIVVGGSGDDTSEGRLPGVPPPVRSADQLEGGPLPALTYETFEGGTASFADARGRPLVINFWASYCVPCLQEMPAFEAVHRDFGDEVAMVGINVSDAPEAARRMADQTGVTYPLGRDPRGELLLALGGVQLPTTVIVDADGRVHAVEAGELDEVALRGALAGVGVPAEDGP